MRRFLLIDHSIRHSGGHYFDYARRVLDAAARSGFEPILAVNQDFQLNGKQNWRVNPVYRYDFWAGRLTLRAKIPGSIKLLLKNVKHYFNRNRRCTWWLPDRQYIESYAKTTIQLISGLGITPGDFIFIPNAMVGEVLAVSYILQGDKLARLINWHLLFRRNLFYGRRADYASQEKGVEPVRDWFRKLETCDTDSRIFCYTDTDELSEQYNRLGIYEFHTLPLPHYENSWDSGNRRGATDVWGLFPDPAGKQPPHISLPAEQVHIIAKEPLKVVYLGDAREEKGYQNLPGIVKAIWDDHVATGEVVFLLQSNDNLSPGDPEVIKARHKLAKLCGEKVVLLEKKLSTMEYQEQLKSADICLLLYNPENYYARSSGVLIEALMTGIPVIVPAGTWLARQFLHLHYDYLEKSIYESSGQDDFSRVDLCWQNTELLANSSGKNSEAVISGEQKWWSLVNVSPQKNPSLVALEFGDVGNEVMLQLNWLSDAHQVIQKRNYLIEKAHNGSWAYLRLPEVKYAAYLRLEFTPTSPFSPVMIRSAGLCFLDTLSESPDFPLSVVGEIYYDLEEVPDLLRGIIRNYSHYRQTAGVLAQKLQRIHNADTFIERLLKVVNDGDERLVYDLAGIEDVA